jgi:hypothetical protein
MVKSQEWNNNEPQKRFYGFGDQKTVCTGGLLILLTTTHICVIFHLLLLPLCLMNSILKHHIGK